MGQHVFGAGVGWATPQTLGDGSVIATPTPLMFGVMQEISLDVSFELKQLHGQNAFAADVARGKGTVSGKVRWGQINGDIYNSVLFGQTVSAGIQSARYDTTGATIPTTPFQVTPTAPSSGTFEKDLGVIDSNARPMTKVTGTPTTGQYAESSGTYTFASADAGNKVYINFAYTATSTTAKKSTVANVVMGYAPTFTLDVYMPYKGKSHILRMPNCIATKMALATKLDDHMLPELDFSAFAGADGNVFTWATSE